MIELAFFLADEAATLAAGKRLALALRADPQLRWVIYLQGDLGAGKTTLSRGLLQALGHAGSVKSPTYTLVEAYDVSCADSGIKTVYHFDLYRLRDPQELEFLGAQDYFNQDALCLIEWPECGAGHLPTADLVVALASQRAGRDLILRSGTAAGERLLNRFSLREK